jgi:hypothetical protein
MLTRPDKTEYAATFENSIRQVPEGNVLEILESQIGETVRFLDGLPEEKADHCYAPGKWSIKEVVGHLIDSERIMTYRALRFARGDETPLPGYEENDYAENANFDKLSLKVITDELRAVRLSSLYLFRSFDDEMWIRKGKASGFDFSVRTIPYQVVGHEIHHMKIIRERYL